MAAPITTPKGVRLRDPEDYATLRQDILTGVRDEFSSSFPKSFGGVRMELHDVGYDGEDEKPITPDEEFKLRMEDGYLARRLRGTVRLFDEKTGDMLDEKRMSLMRVPVISDRGVFMHGGNDYGMALQSRLRPGVYTRRTANGLLETQFNVRPGSSRAFRLNFDPASAQYKLAVGPGGSSQAHFYSLMHDLGVPDEDMETAWGSEVFSANKEAYDTRVLARVYKHLVPKWQQIPDASRDEQAAAIREALDAAQVARDVVSHTLPNLLDRTKAAAWNAQYLGKDLGMEMLVKQASALEFAPDFDPTRVFQNRLYDHFDTWVESKMLATKRASIAVDLDGTLARTTEGDFNPEVIGEPVPAMLERVKQWIAAGDEVVIFTARAATPSNVPHVKAWLKKHGLGDLEVTNRKDPEMKAFWDDRAVSVMPNTGIKSAVVKQDKKTGKWQLWTADGKRVLGTHDKPEDAYKQEYAIQKSQERRQKQAAAKPVELGERKSTYWICPHCREEIHEKHSYPKDPEWWKSGKPLIEIHRDCGGEFIPPPSDPEVFAFLGQLKSAQTLPPTALEFRMDPVYDWDGTLILRMPGNAGEYISGLQQAELTALGKQLAEDGQPVDIVTARPPLFHPHIRQTAERLGIPLGSIRHGGDDKTDVIRELMRPLIDDDERIVNLLRANLGEQAAQHYKQAAVDQKKLDLARKVTEAPVSPEQADAGNYPKGKLEWNGLTIRIENPKGSVRKGYKPDGTIAWQTRMKADYGYVVGTVGVDGDESDVMIGPHLDSEIVYVVDQIDQKTGEFDEHKTILGEISRERAKKLYLSNYEKGWKVGPITPLTFEQYKAWVKGKARKRKPVSELSSVKLASTHSDFEPDLSGDDMKDAYEAVYGHVGPRLASMEQWPDKWMPPGSDPLGWISWYRKYADGTRTDDDARQIARWKSFKARSLARFLKNPTPRQAFALRYWAIDPLKYLPEQDRGEFSQAMDAYRLKEQERWYASKTASFTADDVQVLAEFLNKEHAAGIPIVGDQNDMEDAIRAWLGMQDPQANAYNQIAQAIPKGFATLETPDTMTAV